MDYRNNKDFTDLNTIIYGHNMRNNSMFGTLDEYESQAYYDKHPIIYILTPSQKYEIELVAGIVVSDSSSIYSMVQTQDDLKSLYDTVVEKSTFETNLSLEDGDRLVTLSTCSDEGDAARYVVMGKINEIY